MQNTIMNSRNWAAPLVTFSLRRPLTSWVAYGLALDLAILWLGLHAIAAFVQLRQHDTLYAYLQLIALAVSPWLVHGRLLARVFGPVRPSMSISPPEEVIVVGLILFHLAGVILIWFIRNFQFSDEQLTRIMQRPRRFWAWRPANRVS